MLSVECVVWIWSVECGVCSADFGGWIVECGPLSVECEVWSLECALRFAFCTFNLSIFIMELERLCVQG